MTRDFEKVLVSPDTTLREVLEVVDRSGLGVALVVNQQRQLLGLATDGDLRRAILNSNGLETPVSQIMNVEPLTAPAGTSTEAVFEMMDYVIRHVPVVDSTKKVCDLVCYAELSKKIPFAVPHIGEQEENEVAETVRSTWLTMGPRVKAFEEQVASYVGAKHAIAVSSGTAALDVALKVLGISPGEEIIVPAFTYIATANAVLYQHAVPVFAEIDPRTFNIDPDDVARKITAKTRCIVSIDYGGQSADYDALRNIADEHGIYLVQDGAHSIGAEYKGRRLCNFGAINTISFHAAKVVTSVEGGMVITDDDNFARLARIIRNQGEDPVQKYYHVLLGHNYRMTDLHAAVGLKQFARLPNLLQKRKEIAASYTEQLKQLEGDVTVPYVEPWNKHAWFFYGILIENRDEVVRYLKSKGIDTRIAWPLPVNKQPLYMATHGNMRYPAAEEVSRRILNLPLYPEMKEEERAYVLIHLKDAIAKTASVKA